MEYISTKSIQKAKRLFKNIKNIAIITHFNPDGDAIGSSLGLYHHLKNQGFQVDVIIPNTFPQFLSWMPASEQIHVYDNDSDSSRKILNQAELLVFLDFNVLDRTQGMEGYLKTLDTPKVLIDHHPDPDPFADVTISNTGVSSTAELMYEFIARVWKEQSIDYNISECLYTGIMTDTGSFSYNSSSPNTYYVVSKLIENGIDKDKIYWKVYDNYSIDRMRLLGHCLNHKMKVFPEFGAAYISINQQELKDFHYSTGDSEGFVNYPLSIKGIIFSVIFIEREGHIKISFRSKGNFEVNKFAERHFNGGGHVNAAGGYAETSLDETLRKFEELIASYKDEILTHTI